MSNRKLFWLVAAFALGTAGLRAQVFPGYLDTVIVPSAPANPSSTCFASSPCARIYALGTSSAANMKCILPGGGACGYFGLSYYAGSWQLFTNPTAAVIPLIQPTLANNSAGLYLIPNGTAVSSQIRLYNSSDLTFTNTASVNMRLTGATAMIETVLTGAGTPATTFNIGELSGNALANFNIQFNGVTKHNFTPTKFTTPAIEITGTTSANCLATDSSGNIGAGSSCGATLQTNGTNNSSQTTLNLQNGTNTTASNPSAGNVQVNVAAATASSLGVAQCDGTTITCSGGVITAVGATLQTNGTNNSSQTTLNLQNGTNTTASNPSAGNVQVNVATATSASLGVVEPDNSTITIAAGVLTAVIPAATPVQSYLNGGGVGYRQGAISFTSTITMNGNNQCIINGGPNNGCVYFAGSSSGYMDFNFMLPIIVDEATWIQTTTSSEGTWQWSGNSNSGCPSSGSYVNIGSTFTLGGALSQVITTLHGNTTSYQCYRVTLTSGSTNNSPYIGPMFFRTSGAR